MRLISRQADARGLLPSALPTFALDRARAFDPSTDWRPAGADEIRAYEFQRAFDLPSAFDAPAPELDDPLLAHARALGGFRQPAPIFDDPSAFHAVHAIGVEVPDADPPPFYDADGGTAYWIGIFQPDKDNRAHCVTAILSLEVTDDGYEAQLAPCAPGDWEQAHAAAVYLIGQAHKGGIERALDAAEGMALATGERALWEAEREPLAPPRACQQRARALTIILPR